MRYFPHMPGPAPETLSRRERQAMDLLYQMGQATAQDIWEAMPDRPHYSSVRSLLGVLEEKGLVSHGKEGRRYLYKPRAPAQKARNGALKRLLKVFFDDSPEQLVAGLLDAADTRLSADESARIRKLLAEHERKMKDQP